MRVIVGRPRAAQDAFAAWSQQMTRNDSIKIPRFSKRTAMLSHAAVAKHLSAELAIAASTTTSVFDHYVA
jgi:hypothetical protein